VSERVSMEATSPMIWTMQICSIVWSFHAPCRSETFLAWKSIYLDMILQNHANLPMPAVGASAVKKAPGENSAPAAAASPAAAAGMPSPARYFHIIPCSSFRRSVKHCIREAQHMSVCKSELLQLNGMSPQRAAGSVLGLLLTDHMSPL